MFPSAGSKSKSKLSSACCLFHAGFFFALFFYLVEARFSSETSVGLRLHGVMSYKIELFPAKSVFSNFGFD